MKLENWLNRQSQWNELGHFILSNNRLPAIDGLYPACIRFIQEIKSNPVCWNDPLTEEDLEEQSQLNRIITEYHIIANRIESLSNDDDNWDEDEYDKLVAEMDSLYEDFMLPLFEFITPENTYYGSSPDDEKEIGFWKTKPTDIKEFDDSDEPDFKCEDFNLKDRFQLITDSQDVKAVFESIGKPELYDYFQGLFVAQSEGEYKEVYGFVGCIPYNFKPCWTLL